MANLKVFVSSTCYDLNIIRSQLREFILSYGFEPIMSDYSDIPYDPRNHTHESCINEVIHGDMLIVIIGSRFGGSAIPKAREIVNFDSLNMLSKKPKFLEECKEVSITQLEVLRAMELGIPIFPFIQDDVKYDHNLYEKNKDNAEIIDQIYFPSIQKKGTAKYIFEFINFIRSRTNNNAIEGFSKLEDINTHLRKQWSGLFQRLLSEQKLKKVEEVRFESITSQLEDLKTAFMTSIESPELKVVAQAAVKYRRLLAFLLLLANDNKDLLLEMTFLELVEKIGVEEMIPVNYSDLDSIVDLQNIDAPKHLIRRTRSIIKMKNGNIFALTVSKEFLLEDMETYWNEFLKETGPTKQALIDAAPDFSDQRWIWYFKKVED
ncbi:DUF4062 domain-containing protein [Priestia megaterium]|uniref:DUF4062 domain-containing protein n=1 Tax=Priestia megaterium TaxID=1404 RepID=UPI002E251F15|nr:DUF4062 domain-containing protein [Priestia megaterium]